MPTLLEALADVPNPRGLIRPPPAVLALAVVALLPGTKTLEAIAQFRRARTPTKSALSKLFRRLDPARAEAALARWRASTAKRSAGGGLPGAHLLSAYAPAAAAVARMRVGAETSGHKAALGLLGVTDLRGKVVTADAKFTHRLSGGGAAARRETAQSDSTNQNLIRSGNRPGVTPRSAGATMGNRPPPRPPDAPRRPAPGC